MAKKPAMPKSVETLKHEEDKRKNIPTAEYQSVLQKEQESPRQVRYPRNTDLDPQLMWRGKDEQDWSDFLAHPSDKDRQGINCSPYRIDLEICAPHAVWSTIMDERGSNG